MESGIKATFIPREPLDERPRAQVYAGGSPFDLIALLCIILAIASAALGVGMFLYVKFLETSKTSKVAQLQRAQEAFEPALIAELTRLDDRMSAGNDVLNNHIAPSLLFTALEQLTLETVSFASFNLTVSDTQEITLEMRGRAKSVNAIALQADLFGKHPAIASPLFSNINRGNDGVVGFDLSANINPSALRYTTLVANRNQLSDPQAGQLMEVAGDTEPIPGFTQ
jgi:hypothetical protein